MWSRYAPPALFDERLLMKVRIRLFRNKSAIKGLPPLCTDTGGQADQWYFRKDRRTRMRHLLDVNQSVLTPAGSNARQSNELSDWRLTMLCDAALNRRAMGVKRVPGL